MRAAQHTRFSIFPLFSLLLSLCSGGAFAHAEQAIALEGLAHNAAANDAAIDPDSEKMDSIFAGKSGGNAAANDTSIDTDSNGVDAAFSGHSGGNAASNDAAVDNAVGEEADNFFGGSAVKSARNSDDAGQPRNYLAGMDYRAPNYLQGQGW